MRYQFFLYTAILSIALPLFTSAEPHGPSHRRHSALANRKRTSLELQTFHRRDNNARLTFYDVGLGACGKTNSPGDFIVALNSCEFGSGFPGPQCFKTITIEYNGIQATAQITDECPGCPCGGLDLSTGLFTHFAPESVGVLYANWWYNGGGSSPAPSPSPTPKPSPTSTWTPPSPSTSSVWVDPSPWTSQTSSSTWSAPSSSSSSRSSSSSSWSSSSWSSSSSWNSSSSWTSHSSTASKTSSSSSYAPAATSPPAAENLNDVNKIFAQLGTLVVQRGA